MGPTGTGNGIDEGATSFSMFTYNVAGSPNTWSSVNSTDQPANVFRPGRGYRMFIRGDRTFPITTSTSFANETTLRATGTPVIGDVIFAGGAAAESHGYLPPLENTIGDFTLVGNPYASSVDVTAVMSNNSGAAITSGINPNYYWIWDAQMSGSNNRGRYVVYDLGTNTNNGPGSQVDRHIQSGQSFFVQTIASDPTLAFTESNKTSDVSNIFKNTSVVPKLDIQLLLDDTVIADAAYVKFDPLYAGSVGFDDARKLVNADENLAIFRDGFNISIEARPDIILTDTIPLNIWQLEDNGNYKLSVSNEALSTLNGIVRDKYLGVVHQLDMSGATSIPFTLQLSDPSSFGAERFEIILGTVPLSAISSVSQIARQLISNPVRGRTVRIMAGALKKGTYEVFIYDVGGRVLFKRQLLVQEEQMDLNVEIPVLPNGAYGIVVTGSGTRINQQLILLND
jgi:hypothetical protein